jgi:beta-phosphoglucomutase-like phosphatase (HAD superfamily)
MYIMNLDFTPLQPYVKKIDLVAWDCDGTLVDNEGPALDVIRQEHNRYIQESNDPRIKGEYKVNGVDCCRHYAGKDLSEIRQIIGEQVGIEIPEIVEQRIMERRRSSPERDEVVQPVRPLAALAAFFHDHGVRQIVVTSSEADRAKKYLHRAGLAHYFAAHGDHWLISGYDFTPARRKPDPAGYAAARELFDVHPRRTLSFEDTPHGVLAAVRDGLHAIGHLLPSHLTNEKRSVIAAEMAQHGATAIVHRAEDLVGVLKNVMAEHVPERYVARAAARPTRTIPVFSGLAAQGAN